MSFVSNILDLVCKKRKSPASSHSSSPSKETQRNKTSNSSNNRREKTDRQSQPKQNEPHPQSKESTPTQLISDSKSEVSLSEAKRSQGSPSQTHIISARVASPVKQQDIQMKEEEREKRQKIVEAKPNAKAKTEDFMQGEGLQPIVKRRQKKEYAKEGKSSKTLQEKAEPQNRKEKKVVEVKNDQKLDEGEFSEELSYECSSNASSATDSLASLEEISLVESEYVFKEDKKPVKSPERGNSNKVGEKKEIQSIKRTKAEALEELTNFPLSELKLAKDGFLDERRTLTKKYMALCKEAGEDAKCYYYNRTYLPNKQEINEEAANKSSPLKKAEGGENEEAMRELKKFSLKELKLTKDQNFDQRYKQTKLYLDLCEKAKKDPKQYYKENLKDLEKSKEISKKKEL